MAGIGFRLQSLLDEDSYTSTLKAYAYSGLIASGPFLITILVVTLVNWAAFDNISAAQLSYFQNLITYAYAYALITLGLSQLVVTRYIADSYYTGHTTHFAAIFFSNFAANALIWSPGALYFLSGLSVGWSLKLAALLLYLSTMGIWLALIFLSAAKDYVSMARAFLIGAAVSAVGAAVWGERAGLEGYFAGFVVGQIATFYLLISALLREFGYTEARDFYWLGYFLKHPRLALIGLAYNLGIWIDKFLFWASPEGKSLDSNFSYCPVYDAPLFYSYLTVVPSLAYFLFRMETDFFLKYQGYYNGIERQESLASLEKRRQAIVESLSHNLLRMVLFQGILSGLVLLIVPWIAQATRLDPLQMGVLRIGIFASFLQLGVLIVMNLLLYFDLQADALIMTSIFFLANGVLTALSLRFGLPAFGYGYSMACFLSLICGFALLNERLRLLHYWTFVRQPMPALIPQVDIEGE